MTLLIALLLMSHMHCLNWWNGILVFLLWILHLAQHAATGK
jgi:hypothetical protein